MEEQIVLLGRVRRALRAWVRGRMDVDTFDRIIARINERMGLA